MKFSKAPNIAPVVAVDIGNVCVNLKPDECAIELGFSSVQEVIDFCPEIFEIGTMIESGKITTNEFLDRLKKVIKRELTNSSLIQAWNLLIGEEIEGMSKIIEQINEMNLSPVFFSNISDLHYTHVLENLSFGKEMYGAVLSYEVGDVKPNNRIYEYMESKYCAGGSPVLYLDDRPENIASGEERGWNCYEVGTIAGIREKLEEIKFSS